MHLFGIGASSLAVKFQHLPTHTQWHWHHWVTTMQCSHILLLFLISLNAFLPCGSFFRRAVNFKNWFQVVKRAFVLVSDSLCVLYPYPRGPPLDVKIQQNPQCSTSALKKKKI
jgi:hypothetical protein